MKKIHVLCCLALFCFLPLLWFVIMRILMMEMERIRGSSLWVVVVLPVVAPRFVAAGRITSYEPIFYNSCCYDGLVGAL